MKKFRLITLFFAFFVVAFMFGCSNSKDFSNKIKVVYELEGGKFQNSEMPVTYYFSYDETEKVKIYDPITITKKNIERPGYDLIGWETRTEVDGEVVTKEWNFSEDLVGLEGITLYAKWKRQLTHTYNLCYWDENGEKVSLYKYEVNSGDKFSDYLNYGNKRLGYTKVGYQDFEGNPWDESFVHPGGEEDCEIDVFVEYIEGIYKLIYDADDFIGAANSNIFLMNDIDMGGKKLSFAGYKKIFNGNNKTISNFVVETKSNNTDLVNELDNPSSQKNSVDISIFGKLEGAVIKDVTFENVTYKIETSNSRVKKIYVSPLCGLCVDSTISNVHIKGEYQLVKLPADFDETKLIYTTNQVYFSKDSESVEENTTVNIETSK